jgi:DNA-binding CsgD family transcriptional regulator
MADLTFGIVVANLVLFGGLAGWGVRYVRREGSPRIRTLAWALVAVSVAFVLFSLTRLAFFAIAQGWISGQLGEFLDSSWVLVQSLLTLSIGVLAVLVIQRAGRSLRESERVVALLSERLLGEASLEDFGFTSRELEVLQVMADGTLSDREISEILYISPATAATHVRNILKKSGVRSRRELVLLLHSGSR